MKFSATFSLARACPPAAVNKIVVKAVILVGVTELPDQLSVPVVPLKHQPDPATSKVFEIRIARAADQVPILHQVGRA